MALLFGTLLETGQAGHQFGAAVGAIADAGIDRLFHAYRVENILLIVRNKGIQSVIVACKPIGAASDREISCICRQSCADKGMLSGGIE